MPFEIPSDLHPDLMPIAFLLGHWHGNGHGDYPTIEAFQFRQEVGFTHDGRPFLHYLSRTWLLDDDGNDVRPLALETGFFRPQPEGAIEVLLTHPTGYRRDLLRHGRGRQDRAGHRRRRTHHVRQGVHAADTGSTVSSRATCCGPSTWPPSDRSCNPTLGEAAARRVRATAD